MGIGPLMEENIKKAGQKAGNWIAERRVPFESKLAGMSDRLDEVKERREANADDEQDGSSEDEQQQEESSSQ